MQEYLISYSCYQVCFIFFYPLSNFGKESSMSELVNISEKLSLFDDHWNPRIVGELNGQHVKLAKLKGEFIWHKHDEEDELFYVLQGVLKMEFRDKTVTIKANEFLIVPRGVEHKPVAEEEVSLMLFEPTSTINTGDVSNERTKTELKYL